MYSCPAVSQFRGNKSNYNSHYRELFKLDFIPFSWYWNRNLSILFLFSPFHFPLMNAVQSKQPPSLYPRCLPAWPRRQGPSSLVSVSIPWDSTRIPPPTPPGHVPTQSKVIILCRHIVSNVLFLLLCMSVPTRMLVSGEQRTLLVCTSSSWHRVWDLIDAQ